MDAQIPTLLDIALSLTFVFFIVSMFVSGIWEFIGTVLQDKRARLLLEAFERMLGDPTFATLLYSHPLIKGHIVERPLQGLERFFGGLSSWEVRKEDKAHLTPTDQNKLSLQEASQKVDSLSYATPVSFSQGVVTRLIKFCRDDDNNYKADKVVNTPAYIAPSVFSRALLGLLNAGSTQPLLLSLAQIQDLIKALPDTKPANQTLPNAQASTNTIDSIKGLNIEAQIELRKILAALIQDATDVKGFITNIENWYTEYMNRLSGYYKQYSQQGVRWVAIGVVLLLNLDAFNLTIRLYNDPVLRAALVADAQTISEQVHSDTLNVNKAQTALKKQIQAKKSGSVPQNQSAQDSAESNTDTTKKSSLVKSQNSQSSTAITASDTVTYLATDLAYLKQLPFGWTRLINEFCNATKKEQGILYILTVIIGWVLMVGAVSFGAPFWFDLLLKLVNIRNVGKNPSEKT